MRIVVDTERCILAGECVYNHPGLFGFSDAGPPEVLAQPTTAAQQLGARQAAEVCPSGAITLVD